MSYIQNNRFKKNKLSLLALAVVTVGFFAISWGQTAPHERLDSANLFTNTRLSGTTGWTLNKSSRYDASVSRSGGSGSIVLTVPYRQSSSNSSDFTNASLIPVVPDRLYTVSAFMRTNTWPAADISVFASFYDASGRFRRNTIGGFCSVTDPNIWQECLQTLRPQAGENFVRVRFYYMQKPKQISSATIWLDDLYLGEGFGAAQAPTAKVAFNGHHVRVDPLGNMQIKNDGKDWRPFFPLAIYADSDRPDWGFYSRQGFNMNMWAGGVDLVARARRATSSFNPQGMYSGFDVSDFALPQMAYAGNTSLMKSRINAIAQQGLIDSVLLYYWDNENAYDEWQLPLSVLQELDRFDTIGGQRRLPTYALQGHPGLARKFLNNRVQVTDIVGSYTAHFEPYAHEAEYRGAPAIKILDHQEGQRSPVSIAQINASVGLRFRPRVFNAIAQGARGIGVWRDQYYEAAASTGRIRIERNPWWSTLPQVRREIDQLMPILRTPHWTSWTALGSNSAVDIGSRELNGIGYLILTNEKSNSQTTNISLQNLPYSVGRVDDYFSGQQRAAGSNFSITVPAYDAIVLVLRSSGTAGGVAPAPAPALETTPTADLGEPLLSTGLVNYAVGDLRNGASLSGSDLVLDGVSDFLDMGNKSTLDVGTSDFSLFSKVRIDSSSGPFAPIITKGAAADNNPGFSLVYQRSTDSLVLILGAAGESRLWLESNRNLNLVRTGEHVVGVSVDRNDKAFFFVDGAPAGSASAVALNGFSLTNTGRSLLVGSWIEAHFTGGRIGASYLFKTALGNTDAVHLTEQILGIASEFDFDLEAQQAVGDFVGNASWSAAGLQLDGSGDYWNSALSNNHEIHTGDFTLVADVFLQRSGEYAGIITKGGASNVNEGYALVYRRATDSLVLTLSDGGGTRLWIESNGSLGLNNGQWHRVAVSVDRSGLARFFSDGREVGSGAVSQLAGESIWTSSLPVQVGAWINDHHFGGTIRDAVLIKAALTRNEVSDLNL